MTNILSLDILQKTVEDLPVGVGVFKIEDPSDLKSVRYVFMNKIILHEMRKTKEEVFGNYIYQVAPEAFAHEIGLKVIETYRDVAISGKSVDLGVVKYENHEVAGMYNCSVHPIQDEYVYVLLRNVTELMKSKEELVELNKSLEQKVEERTRLLTKQNEELEQFVYIASHDLQEPLNTLNGFTDLLESECADELSSSGKKYLGFISSASIQMRNLVHGVLLYSRIGRKTSISKIDCNTVVKEVVDDLRKREVGANAQITLGELPVVSADEMELKLLFQNLILNAITFKKENTTAEVHISATKKDGFWQFSIKDNGIGIAQEYSGKIFRIFQRLHAKSVYEGTGIGLAHCRKIVELYNGSIWFESTPEEGSTFFFTLPVNEQ